MCAVSMVGDSWRHTLPQQFPWMNNPNTTPPANSSPPYYYPVPSREEFEKLRAEVEQMKKELQAARKKDIADGDPDCEMEEKVAFIKKIADLVGVDLEDIFPVDIKKK